MNIRIAVAVLFLFSFALAHAEPEDMRVNTRVAGCEYAMNTNGFDLGPGQSVEIDLDLSGCSAERLGGLLYFGYIATQSTARPLNSRSRVRLTLRNNRTGQTRESDIGYIFTEVTDPAVCTLIAENVGRKTVTIRLRSSSGL